MDSAADSLLALSHATTALPPTQEPLSDDDRSSSLSELEDDLDDGEEEELEPVPLADADSEAETERLQVTPENLARKKPLEISPSKLSQRQDVDMRPEIESLTESAVSSPISSHADADNDDALSDDADLDEDLPDGPPITVPTLPNKLTSVISSPISSHADLDNDDPLSDDADIDFLEGPPIQVPALLNKRKREESGSDVDLAPRSQRRRTGSPESEDEKSEPERGQDAPEIPEEEQKEVEKTDTSEDSKGKARSRPRRKGKDPVIQEPQADAEEDAEAAEDSEPADENDAEAALKSEEEQARRMAAMESLVIIEKQFATLRDRLYDERIAAINHELQLLQESKPAHPDLIRQVEVVQKYRDEKFEVEQKLLVYKVGALKNKAVAERSQIHSQYFQTVRDIRETHLERISEHFYRIQRDRFKADSSVPNFSIPFPLKRSQQILQQTAYNKEVSILSGVAKYVGFPAAPELASSTLKDVEDDIQKMGISPSQIRPVRPTQRPAPQAQISGPQAEEQFLEQTPWANPQHPIHRLSRQNSNRSPLNGFATPANQQRNTADGLQPPVGSASTIVDPMASAHASSAVNTPAEGQGSAAKPELQASNQQAFRMHSASPLDMRRHPEHSDVHSKDTDMMGSGRDVGSSPLTSRAYLSAPTARPPAITAGTGRFSLR